MLRQGLAVALVLAAITPACHAGAADPVRLASHRALYQLVMQKSHPGSGVAGVDGEMAVEWRHVCDGWTFEHQSLMNISFAGGEVTRLSVGASSWESDDGLRYRFGVRHERDGDETGRFEGTAFLKGAGRGGEARFTAPEPHVVKLPPGTLFPVAHTVAVIKEARRATLPTIFSRIVFDGMGDEGAMAANAIIGKADGAREKPAGGAAAVRPADKMSWPINLAYFPLNSPEPQPKQEIAMRLYDDGVTDRLVMDFEDFTVRGTLVKLEYLKGSDCGD